MSSFTKLIAPGVRTGFMIGEPTIIGKLAKIAEDTYISPGYVAQAITYEWCRRGLLPPQIERLKALYAPRLDACLAGIDKSRRVDRNRWAGVLRLVHHHPSRGRRQRRPRQLIGRRGGPETPAASLLCADGCLPMRVGVPQRSCRSSA